MIYVFELVSPGSDLDGEEWSFTAATRAAAEARADERMVGTFALASAAQRAITSLRLLGTQKSRTAALEPYVSEANRTCRGCAFESVHPLAYVAERGRHLCAACLDDAAAVAA